MSGKKLELTAVWGNDDCESTIIVTGDTWEKIKNGEEESIVAAGHGDGKRFPVTWLFKDKLLTIEGEDCAQHVLDLNIDEIYTNEI